VFIVVVIALFPWLALAERVNGRVLDVNERHNEVSVDVAGQRRTYHIEDRSLYRVLHRDRRVIIRAELVRGRHTIVDAEPAAREGRVERVDYRHSTVVIRDSESHVAHTYSFEQGMPRDVHKGQLIAFDVEERGSRDVITGWHRK
jgi:hypothetical protein